MASIVSKNRGQEFLRPDIFPKKEGEKELGYVLSCEGSCAMLSTSFVDLHFSVVMGLSKSLGHPSSKLCVSISMYIKHSSCFNL